MAITRNVKVKTSLKLKVILSLGVILSGVFFVSGYMTYTMHVQIAQDEIRGQFVRTTDQIMRSIDKKIEGSQKLSNQIIFHPIISELIQKGDVDYYETSAVQGVLDQMMLSEPQLLSINLFDRSGNQHRPANSFLYRPLSDRAYAGIIERLQHTDGELIWFRTGFEELFLQSTVRNDAIVAVRWMKNEKLETYGVLVFIFHERYFRNELQGAKNEDTHIYLYNDNEELLYSDDPDPGALPHLRQQWRSDANFVHAESRSEMTDFTLFGRASLAQLKERSRIILNISLYSGLVSIVLSSILLLFAMQRLFTPLAKLVEGMRSVRNGRFDTQIEVRTRDELAFLGDSFNAMIANINQLIEEVYEKQLREREAELKALQAQLNPHFLYNTLDMIYWRLFLEDEHENAQLIVALSDMLRYSLEPIDRETTVKDELHQLNHYLSIQRTRFEDTIHVDVEAEEDALGARVIPLLLQPLVENVFVHAFAQLPGDRIGRLAVRLRRVDNELIAEIEDNGTGMRQEAIDELLNDKPNAQDQHIGIRSVMRRIELVYGHPYRLEIESEYGEYTIMRLVLPYMPASGEQSGGETV